MHELTKAQKKVLARNGFVVVPSNEYVGMAEAYEGLKKDERPIFVTTDALLHTAHLFFDYLLRIVEWTAVRTQLVSLTEVLLEASALDVAQARDRQVKEAAQHNLAFFAVGARLLDPSHVAVQRLPRRVYVLLMPPLKQMAQLRTAASLAELFCQAVRSTVLPGPLVLAGVGAGGVIAHEMAVQMQRAGHEVGLLLLLLLLGPIRSNCRVQ